MELLQASICKIREEESARKYRGGDAKGARH